MISTTALVGCAVKDTAASKQDQAIRYNLGAEPKTIDPGLTNTSEGLTVAANSFEGLLRLDEKENPVSGVAEKWEISPDGLKYTFNLRKDAKWSDGKPVKAEDFKYAWQRALDPKVASEYAYQLFYIKNGENFNKGKCKAEDLGIKVIDDSKLEVTLEYPTSYFLSLTTFPTYAPVRKDIVEKDSKAWANKPDTFVCNGPFKMKEWKLKDSINFVKNENYWNAKSIKLDSLQFKLIEQPSSALSAFRAGQIDFMEAPPLQETPNLLKEGIAKVYPYLGTCYVSLNVSSNAQGVDAEAAKALSNPKVRKALALSIDRTQMVQNVTKGGQKPATAFVSNGIMEDKSGKDFRNKDYYKPEGDVAEAKRLLAEAGYPDGKGFPKLSYLYNTGEDNKNIAEALQDMWRKNLGITVEIINQEKKVFMNTRKNKDYLTARGSWIADYSDPMTFLDVWITNGGNNNTGYSNAEYDKKISNAKAEKDPAKRMQLLHDAEDILMNDMPIIPIYFYVSIGCSKDYVKGVHKSPLGMTFFDKAYIQK
ncbi:peptide ABC transporter substrate-binding protein [Clostridium sp. PL3]|uniref:Peptide ABC transporter substrate-binding protein n=1 Tax=Clostridium thailandense TaxID=2794346 RepID=A0A949TVA6_9CLOT|nr:peptide ABC transporter substrate-binding protein [Clostridium thailandense]MBV7272095.1 peptide ABC transporter substrate-binding protein [Clostridium thailandense]